MKVKKEADLQPGMRVHGSDGVIGTVEPAAPAAGSEADPSFLARSADGRALYRLPLSLVRSLKQDAGPAAVVLDLRVRDLDRYLATDSGGALASERQLGSGDLRIPVHAEELVVEKQPVTRGAVHLHKGVETVEQQFQVPVVYEEAVVEHLAPDQYQAGADGEEDALVIPIYEEQLVVEKRMVIKEYVRVRKQRKEMQQTVTEPVRREFVEVREREGT